MFFGERCVGAERLDPLRPPCGRAEAGPARGGRRPDARRRPSRPPPGPDARRGSGRRRRGRPDRCASLANGRCALTNLRTGPAVVGAGRKAGPLAAANPSGQKAPPRATGSASKGRARRRAAAPCIRTKGAAPRDGSASGQEARAGWRAARPDKRRGAGRRAARPDKRRGVGRAVFGRNGWFEWRRCCSENGAVGAVASAFGQTGGARAGVVPPSGLGVGNGAGRRRCGSSPRSWRPDKSLRPGRRCSWASARVRTFGRRARPGGWARVGHRPGQDSASANRGASVPDRAALVPSPV